ncbi:glycerol-3-phosphate responsive antiterminator [Clostridium chauvoei]|uniref:glycerol-3-phosphate responsive antiterminator n=1 Tax=Clostridium chauvoei TaxID=46867 RepID=UPI001C85043F|nr:glycerol-3-phosphate responsive antiterminator [Clostridium chauvoei]MBX7356239.1 glycerol-3-phosphate responsive antiterminator [Clostridium chauvoei]
MNIRDLLEENPVIAAVKNYEDLELALDSELEVIFVLFGDLLNVKDISKKISDKNKIGIVHVDLLEGITNKEVAIKFLKKETSFKGIISTKSQVVKAAKSNGFISIQRIFVFDTLSLNNAKKHLMDECDAIEVLPGIIPKVIKELAKKSSKPIVSGGLIDAKEEIIMALNSGANCVSTTKKEIWNM